MNCILFHTLMFLSFILVWIIVFSIITLNHISPSQNGWDRFYLFKIRNNFIHILHVLYSYACNNNILINPRLSMGKIKHCILYCFILCISYKRKYTWIIHYILYWVIYFTHFTQGIFLLICKIHKKRKISWLWNSEG
jgi:hypothetical protein